MANNTRQQTNMEIFHNIAQSKLPPKSGGIYRRHASFLLRSSKTSGGDILLTAIFLA